jgi:plastocyanin
MTGTVNVTGAGGPEPGQVAAPTTVAGKGPATSAAARAETTTTSRPKAAPGGSAGPGTTIDLAAKNIEFDKKSLTFKANSPVLIHFDNLDAVPHNVDITTESGGGGTTIFKEDPFSGPTAVDYRFTAPGPGRLYFRCDVHPNMTGTINVQ